MWIFVPTQRPRPESTPVPVANILEQIPFIVMDNELLRVWQLLHELSDQLNHNQKISTALQSQAHALKVRFICFLMCF